jgi:PAS domain S-box-containing protein
MILISDSRGNILMSNPVSNEKLGHLSFNERNPFQLQQIISKNDQQSFLYQQYGKNRKGSFAEAIQMRLLKEKKFKAEWHLVNHKNEHIPVLSSISSLMNDEGQFVGFVIMACDITERKKHEKQILDSLEKEKKLGSIKSRFVTIASHEFRTPLSTILSSANLAAKYKTEEDQYKRERHINRIVSAVNTLTDILNDFLNVGKIEEGKISIKLSKTDIEELFRSVLHDIRANAKKGQFFIYEHAGAQQFNTDQSLVRNILINLISNAIKFSPESSTIRIFSSADHHSLRFRVEDEGIGIEARDMAHLAKRFFRGSNATNIQGTGLGLHIVAKYVERLHGKMECESEAGAGTTLSISIPVGEIIC